MIHYRIDSNYPVLLGERARSRATSSHCSSYLPSSEEGLVDFSKGVSSYSQERLIVLGDRYTRSGDSGTFADSEFDGWRGGFAWLESVHGLRVKPDNSSQFGIILKFFSQIRGESNDIRHGSGRSRHDGQERTIALIDACHPTDVFGPLLPLPDSSA